MKKTVNIALLALVTLCISAFQEGIVFQDDRVENNFPIGLTFQISAASSAGQIVSANFYYRFQNEITTTKQSVEFQPSDIARLSYTFDTTKLTVPPSAPITYYWEVVDAAGSRAATEEKLIYYDDVRYEWQILEDQRVSVWWHDRPPSFGADIFAIANQALDEQRLLYPAELDFPIKMIFYNTFEEFAEWHAFVGDFVGGQAFASYGLTTQIAPESEILERWLNNVIPHEVSHMYFYQLTDSPLSDAPIWLDEGLAQYNEFGDNSDEVDAIREEIMNGDYIQLAEISFGGGNTERSLRKAYAQSLGAATFLIEFYGEAALANLLAAYKSGASDDDAFQQAVGLDLFDFQRNWVRWMQGTFAPTPAPTAIPSPTPIPPTPTATPEAPEDSMTGTADWLLALILVGALTAVIVFLRRKTIFR